MNPISRCEENAIRYFASRNLDISTKEKRIVLDPNIKKEIFNFLVGQFLRLQMSPFGF